MRSIAPLRLFFPLAGLILAPSPAHAQGNAPSLPRFDQQVFVTASRAESTVARVPALVILIDEDDIRHSPAQDIPDLLRQAGLHVTDLTGARRSFRVDLQGFGATAGLNTLVLVDGRRINQPDLSGSDWALIPLHRVARIEVIRGSGAVAFGDNAAGGVINIITKNAGPAETRLAVSGGGLGTFTPEASTRGSRGRISYALSGRAHRSDGHRENARTKGGDFGGQLVVQATQRFRATISGGYHGDRTGLPGSLTESALESGIDRSATLTPDDFADVDDGYAMVTPRVALGDQAELVVDISARERNSKFFSSFTGGQFTGDTSLGTIAASPRVIWSLAFGGARHGLVAGVDLARTTEDISNTSVFGGTENVGLFTLEKTGQAVFVRDEVQAGRASVSGGYRFDAADFSFDPSVPSARSLEAHAADLGVTVTILRRMAAFASLSRSFRYPVLDELFDFFTSTIDPGLLPQRTVGVEAGMRFEVGVARATVSAFHSTTRDEIFFNPVGGPFGFGDNQNLDGDSRRTGVDFALQAQIGRAIVAGALSLLDTTIDGGMYDGQSMPGVPARRASIEARMPLARAIEAGLQGTYTGARRFEGDFIGTFGQQEGFFLLDARIAYGFGRARFRLDVKNLLDENYSDFGVLGGFPVERAFYPSPGIHALAGVDVDF
jgi:iron complex outermembrane receptor protein